MDTSHQFQTPKSKNTTSAREWTLTREAHQEKVVAEEAIEEEAEVVRVATEAEEEEVDVVAEEDKEVVLAKTTRMVKRVMNPESTKAMVSTAREVHPEKNTMIAKMEKEDKDQREESTKMTEEKEEMIEGEEREEVAESIEEDQEVTTNKTDQEESIKMTRATLPPEVAVAIEKEATDKLTTMVRDQEEEVIAAVEVDREEIEEENIEEEAAQEEEEMVREVDTKTEVPANQESLENIGNQENRDPESQSSRSLVETNFQKSELARVNSMLTIPA